ncbi:MAG TPA: alpha/beta hydrolase family protein [bacterium]|nr:alpha/beta hydrolase family protein [bacterium]HPN44843.1 alpha/beta hydrolase family protein [bacterium]
MRKTFFFLLLLAFSTNLLAIPHGQVREGLSFSSKLLNKAVPFSIYLPADYDQSTRKYPVVYLLHGYSDDETAWVQFGEVNLAADVAIENRQIPPMIIVMPDAEVTFYMNDYQNKYPWEDMFIKEFIPYIEKEYRIRGGKEYRGVAGLSMGGFGTLLYALRYPDMFAACAAFSSAIWTDEEMIAWNDNDYNFMFTDLLGKNLKGKERLTKHWQERHSLDLAKSLPVESLKKVRIYMDCGDDDFLIKGNCALHLVLKDRNIPHEFRVRDGEHNWLYWRTGITDGLKFIGQSFNR